MNALTPNLDRVPVFDIPENCYPFDKIAELTAPSAPLAFLLKLDRDALAAVAEIIVAVLDATEGDYDLEDNNDREEIDEREDDNSDREPDDEDDDDADREEDDDDGCLAGEDLGTDGPLARRFMHSYKLGAGAGDPDDAEPGEDDEWDCDRMR